MAYIYVLKNKINNKCYVGQTVNIIKRFSAHKMSKNFLFISKAIRKHGWKNFEKFVFVVPESELDYFEVELIKRLVTLSPNGYNLETGGHTNKHHHNETKNKISKANKGKLAGKNNPNAKQVINLNTREIFDTASDVFKKYNIGISDIIAVCKGRRLTAGGYLWAYYNKNTKLLTKKELKQINLKSGQKGKFHPMCKKIICLETNEVFNYIKEVENKYGVLHTSICNCLKGYTRTAGGYHWMYYEDYLKQQQDLKKEGAA